VRWFDYAAPTSVANVLSLLREHPQARLLAGGTDLLVQLRTGRRTTDFVIDIKRVPELNELNYNPKTGLTLGSAVPCYRIYEDRAISAAYPALADVAALIGGTQIQNRASIGGNLCNAAPSADSIPILIALNARCRIAGPGGEREVPVEDFCTGPGTNILAPGEILLSLRLPPMPSNSGACYLRFIPRNEMDIAVAGAGVEVELANGMFRAARVALAAVAATPLLVKEAGEALAGQPVGEAAIQRAAAIASQAARPITDMRGTAEYRRHLCAVLTRRALETAVRRAREGR
jgi:carbon-monoxide dehydrogenase medium subunit